MNILDNLNDRQAEAVQCISGPLLIVAGAGSGKTKALTHRIAYMIEQGVTPWQILAVTFTNKAAKEMEERITNLLQVQQSVIPAQAGIQQNNVSAFGRHPITGSPIGVGDDKKIGLPTMGTFHSICAKLLRSEIERLGYERDFVIYDSQDQLSAMKQIFKKKDIDTKQWNPKTILYSISNYKNQLYSASMVKATAGNYSEEFTAEMYQEYQDLLKGNNALDFDDLIMLTVKVFESFPEVLQKYQKRWQYILVDEYQDTNNAQYKLIRLLAEQHKNLCVVGDSDQSIYAFRGANIGNILSFETEFPEAKVIKLEQNYRSTKNILGAANNVIENNRSRVAKDMWTENEGGEKIQVWEERNGDIEADKVAEEIIKNYKTRGENFSKHTVLYRTNAQSRLFEEVFLRHQIPYKIIGGLKFYARKEVKDILAYLRILQNPADTVSLLRIINVPARKIGATSLNKVQNFANQRAMSMFEVIKHIEMVDNLTPAAKKAYQVFLDLYETLKKEQVKQPLSEFIDTVLEGSGYKNLLKDGSVENMSRLENLEELKSVASRYDIYDENALQFFLEEVSLVQDSDQIEEGQDAVMMMTVHSAKGLEFDNVFVVGLEEEIFPHSRSVNNPEELEEERRLMYVAMTRARRKLYLTHAKQRMIFGQSSYCMPSRFLSEISEDYCEINNVIPAQAGIQQNNVSAFGRHPITGSPIESGMTGEGGTEIRDGDYVYDEDSQDFEGIPEYQEGMKVYHQTFGEGVIIAIHGMVLTISFGPGNVKKMAATIAPLQILN